MVAPRNNAHGGPHSEGIDHYLIDFLDEVFIPIMLRGKSERCKKCFRDAVKYLGDALRRQPRFSDLNQVSLTRYRERLASVREKARRNLLHALRSLWKLAHELGRSSPPPPKHRPENPPPPAGEPGTVLALYNTAYLPQMLAQRSEIHRKDVALLMHRLRRCFGRDIGLQELSGELLSTFMVWLETVENLGPGTRQKMRSLLLSLWRFAHETGASPDVPRVPRIRIPREEPDAWSMEELGRIIDQARRIEGFTAGIPANKYWPAILLVCWYTGLRRRALHSIQPKHLELEGRWLYVPAGSMKNFVGKRFRLGEDAVAAVREILDPPRKLLFPRHQNCTYAVGEFFKAILTAARVPESRHTLGQFHKMRRTTATHVAAKAGLAAASALLGHSTGELLSRYIDPTYMVGTDATEWLSRPSIS